MKFEEVFVTIGTTKFDKLIRTIASPEIAETLQKIGCKKLVVQFGRGEEVPFHAEHFQDIKVETYRLKQNILVDIKRADLVIAHAGAGTCMEVLKQNKPMVAVINEDLMDNHQFELAEQLFQDGHLFYCTPDKLSDTLLNNDFGCLKPYEGGSGMMEFLNCLDQLMGFQ